MMNIHKTYPGNSRAIKPIRFPFTTGGKAAGIVQPTLQNLLASAGRLSSENKIDVTYLATAAISEDLIRAAFLAGQRSNAPVVFIKYRSQSDLHKFRFSDKDVYTGWDQFQFMRVVRRISNEMRFSYPYTIVRDHGGITFDSKLIEHVKLARGQGKKVDPSAVLEALRRAKESLRADHLAGICSFHIDNSILFDPRVSGLSARMEPVLSTTIELIKYLNVIRKHRPNYGLEVQVNEIGSPRNTDPAEFEYFMAEINRRLGAERIWKRPDFVAANVGTVHGAVSSEPDIRLVRELDGIARKYGARFSQHGTSGVSAEYLRQLPLCAGKANVDSALARERIKAIKDLAPKTFSKISEFVLVSRLGIQRMKESGGSTDKDELVFELSRYYLQHPQLRLRIETLPVDIRAQIIERITNLIIFYHSNLGFSNKETGQKLAGIINAPLPRAG
jgi:fructose/tagatose bisphosphate aldolase